jgi:fatty acid desaturase
MSQETILNDKERGDSLTKLFQEFHRSENIQKLMKARDGSFYANFAFTFFFVGLDLWLAINAISGILSAAAIGIFTGVLFGWIGMLGHDVGHGQAPKGNKHLRIAFQIFLGPVCLGFSSLWWITKHVKHHLYANWEKKDGDLNIPLPFTANQAQERGLSASSFRVKNARWIFPLLLPLQAMNARYSSIRYLILAQHKLWEKTAQYAGILVHFALYGGLLYVIGVHAGWPSAFTFFAFHQGIHGLYNSLVFATNHKGMPTFLTEQTPTWLELQILTSRNVRVDWEIFRWKYGWFLERTIDVIVTWIFGALNYQIEHHLFPTMPRTNLRKVRCLVIEFCRENGFEYYETGIVMSYREVLENFEKVRLELLDSPMGA